MELENAREGNAVNERESKHCRQAYGETLLRLGREREDIVVADADLSGSTRTAWFGKEFPKRFFNFGIAEQNMIGASAGMAASGKTVFVSTFAMFATGRVHDQIRQSIAYPRMNVKIIATHAGITVGGDGASHQINEDVGIMRILPNMTVIVPADYWETAKAVEAIADFDGPVYMRLGRAPVPVIFDEDMDFRIGKARQLRDGDDISIIAMGQMVARALYAAEILERDGIGARVINMSTIKPLDEEIIDRAARETGGIITVEEHSIIGGLGSAVAEAQTGHCPVIQKRIGVPDVFGQSGGCRELLRQYGLTTGNIVTSARELLALK